MASIIASSRLHRSEDATGLRSGVDASSIWSLIVEPVAVVLSTSVLLP